VQFNSHTYLVDGTFPLFMHFFMEQRRYREGPGGSWDNGKSGFRQCCAPTIERGKVINPTEARVDGTHVAIDQQCGNRLLYKDLGRILFCCTRSEGIVARQKREQWTDALCKI